MSGQSTGSLVGTILGGVVGGILAAPTGGVSIYAGIALGASIGGLAGGLAGSLYDTATADDIVNKQQSLADLRLQTSTLGKPIPQVSGKNRLAGNVIWATDKIEHEDRVSESAGKGGGPSQVTVTKTYTISYAIAICDTLITGPMAGISKAWRDTTLIYDRTQQSALPDGWTFYPGDASQSVDPTMESHLGTGNVPAYNNLCYVVIADDNLGRSGRTYVYSFEVYQDTEGSTALATIALSPTTGDVWAVVPALLQAWRIDETTHALTGTVALTAGGFPPPGAIMAPMNVDSSGRPWCGTISADLALHHIFMLDPTGLVVDQEFDVTYRPASNIVFSDGDAWVVVSDETGGTPASYLKRLDPGGTIVATIAVDYATYPRLAVGLDGHIWVSAASGTYTGSAKRVNPATNTVIATIAIGDWANDVYVSTGGLVWVPTYDAATVKRINPATDTITHTITVAARPWRIMEASDGYLWVACRSGAVSRINPATNTAVSYTVPGIVGAEEFPAAFSQLLAPATSGAMWVIQREQNAATRVTTTGTQLSVRVGAGPQDIKPGASNTVWVCSPQSGELVQITDAGVVTGLSTDNSLSNVVTRYCNAAGIPSGNLDLTDLPYALVNVTILNVQAVRSVLELLAQAYRFFLVESGTKLKFRQRGSGSVVATIPEDDLDAGEELAGEKGLEVSRVQEIDLPTKLDINYIDPDRNYESNTQRAILAIDAATMDDNARVMTTPLVLSAGQAKQLAQELLNEIHIQRETLATTLTRAYAHLEPGDRITIAARGLSYSAVLTETTYGKPGLLEMQARPDAFFVVDAFGAVPGVVPTTPVSLNDVGDTEGILLNIPSINSLDQSARYHVAYAGSNTPWPGAALYRSLDGGASYSIQDASGVQGLTGTVALATPSVNHAYLDTTTTITAVMPYGAPVSVADAALYAGANLFMVGGEIMNGGVWTLVDTSTYAITRLLRGRRGTEHLVGTHGTNERLVVLDTSVRSIAMTLADRNVERSYKTITNGQSLADVSATLFTPTAANLNPWGVANADGTLSGSDWVFTWYARSQFNGTDDFTPIGYDPDFVSFRVDIYAEVTYATLKRSTTTDGGSPLDANALMTWTYTATMQTTDFGSTQSIVYYRIYQVTTNGISPNDNLVAA